MPSRTAIQKLQDPPKKGTTTAASGLFPAGLVACRDFDDVDAMAAAVKKWNHEGVQLEVGRFHGELNLAHTAKLQIHRVRLSPAILVRGGGVPGSIAFGIQSAGARHACWRGAPLAATDVMMLDPRDEIDLQTTCDSQVMVISVDRELFAQHAGSLDGQSLTRTHSPHRLKSNSPHAAQILRRRWGELANAALRLGSRLADAQLARQLEAELLEALFNNTSPADEEPTLADRRAVALRARRHMVRHIDVPMTIKDLCDTAHTTQRTLHLGFRETFGITPKKFLKALRLHSARRELQRGEPNATVTETALRWGFFHLARFAGDYRKTFGESPSTTLRLANRNQVCAAAL
jgi:AraC family ethanolamine operon transcriptional activator